METLAVVRLLTAFGEGRPLGPPTADEHRETLLRTAGLLDRLALAEPKSGVLANAASRAGDELASLDQIHGRDSGGGAAGRTYTRRAYAVWIAIPRTLPD